ncbi:MAG: hypothetical protein FWD62_15440 [Betaproteobacteria bacterium]|nr:hypothetical protein [Betaproteobacteria bacterium]
MKLQGPKGCGGASVGGQFFQADKNGVIEVPDEGGYAAMLAPHGFAPIVGVTPAKKADEKPAGA